MPVGADDVIPPVLVFVVTAGATQGAVVVRAAHDNQHDQRDFEGR